MISHRIQMDKWIAKLMSVILPCGSCPLMFRFFPYNLFVGGPIKLCRMVSRVVDEWVMMRRAHCHPTKWIRQMLRTDARLFTFDSHAYINIADSCVYTDHLYMLDECPFGCLVAWCTFPPNTWMKWCIRNHTRWCALDCGWRCSNSWFPSFLYYMQVRQN